MCWTTKRIASLVAIENNSLLLANTIGKLDVEVEIWRWSTNNKGGVWGKELSKGVRWGF